MAQGENMGAKVHKSLRLDNDLVERVERLRNDNEPLSNAMCRVMAVGCDTLEGVAREARAEQVETRNGAREKHDETTERLIKLLEDDKARLIGEVEGYKAAIAEKDAQIAAALEKAHELADQSHVLIGMTQQARELPSPEDGGEVLDVTPTPAKIGFWEWFKNYR